MDKVQTLPSCSLCNRRWIAILYLRAGDSCHQHPRPRFTSLGRQTRTLCSTNNTRIVFLERGFAVVTPKARNTLPADTNPARDTGLFKKKLKTFLFHVAYPANPVSC